MSEEIRSFETGEEEKVGDLLSRDKIESNYEPKIGLLTTGYFEYWNMYPELREKVYSDAEVMADRLREICPHLVYPGIVETIDSADEAGRIFSERGIDLLLIAHRTYVPDNYIHEVLKHIEDVPVAFIVSRTEKSVDYGMNYEETLRNSGMMSEIQLTAGFRKMGIYENLEVMMGDIYGEELYEKISRYLDVITIYERLKRMKIGAIGNVFRGMYDFEFHKPSVLGTLGPEIIRIQVKHLMDLFNETKADDEKVESIVKEVKNSYRIREIKDEDIVKAARLSVALEKAAEKFRLDGITLLGQHYIELHSKTTSALGMAKLPENDIMGTTEGDVLGVIMMKIMKHLSGETPFFGEWSEFDLKRNALLLIGHHFADPNLSNEKSSITITPSPERWGLEGKGFSFEINCKPGTVTFSHLCEDKEGWRMLIGKGESLDIPTIPMSEAHMMMQIEKPIEEFVEKIIKQGWPHHTIVAYGDIRKELSQLADLLGVKKVFL